MKKEIRRLLVVMLTLAMVACMFTGCKKKPTAEDACDYVKAVLDIMCTGEYDHSVKLADVEEGQEEQVRENLVNEIMYELAAETNFSDEVTADFSNLMLEALGKCKYTVVKADPVDDGFDVTVSIEPLRLYDTLGDDYEARLEAQILEDIDEVYTMSEDEQTNYIMSLIISMMREGLENPNYDDPVEVVVHYGVIDDQGTYGCKPEEGQKLGEYLFSSDGMY